MKFSFNKEAFYFIFLLCTLIIIATTRQKIPFSVKFMGKKNMSAMRTKNQTSCMTKHKNPAYPSLAPPTAIS